MLYTKDLVLRDITEDDLDRHMTWELVDNEWHLWDGPWEYEGKSETELLVEAAGYVERLRERMERLRTLPPDARRTTFHFAEKTDPARAIGWVNAYRIDDDCCWTPSGGRAAVGIDIPEIAFRARGYGAQALSAFIAYLLETEAEIFLQTWSGNERMIRLAQRLGFVEYRRKKDLRTVRGKTWDGMTFRLDRTQFLTFGGECETMS